MNKLEIQRTLIENHERFAGYIKSLSEEDFLICFQNKWSAGQQLDHIYKAVAPLAWGLNLPKWLLRMVFGTCTKPSRDYDTLVGDYKALLSNGAKSPAFFMPGIIRFNDRENLADRLMGSMKIINQVLDRFSEEELDKIRVPHALMGKLTIREMMYFTAYHVNHHRERTKLNLELVLA